MTLNLRGCLNPIFKNSFFVLENKKTIKTCLVKRGTFSVFHVSKTPVFFQNCLLKQFSRTITKQGLHFPYNKSNVWDKIKCIRYTHEPTKLFMRYND